MDVIRIFKKAQIIALAAILLTPLMASNAYTDPMLIPKMGYFQGVMGLVVLLSLVYTILKSEPIKRQIGLSEIFLMLFVLWVVVRTIFTNGSTSNNLFMTAWVLLAGYLILMNNKLKGSEQAFLWFAYVLMIVGFIESGYGLLQYFGAVNNPYSTFGATGTYLNPGPYAIFLSGVLPFALGLVLRYKSEWKLRYLAIGCILLIMAVLPLTESRTAWISSLIGCVAVLVLNNQKTLAKWVNTLYQKIGILVVVLVLIGVSGWQLYQYKEGSASGRLFIYERSLEIISSNPFFGVGFDNFSTAYHNTQADFFIQNPEMNEIAFHASNIEHAFNEYLQMAAELGLIGLLLFAVFVCLTLRTAFRSINVPQSLPAIGCMIAILISALFSYPFHEIPVLIVFVFAASIVSSRETRTVFLIEMGKRQMYVTCLLVLSMIGYFLYDGYHYFKAEKKWKKVYISLSEGHVEAALSEYNNLYPVLRRNKLFLYHYGVELGMAGNFYKSIEVLEEAKHRLNDADLYFYLGLGYWSVGNLQQAEEHLLHSIQIIPYMLIPKYRLMEFYDQTGQTTKALEQAYLIEKTVPKIDSETVREIKILAKKYQIDNDSGQD
jgi:O-antigen polymerase